MKNKESKNLNKHYDRFKHKDPDLMTYEERIASQKYKNPTVKPPTMSQKAMKPILKRSKDTKNQSKNNFRNKVLGISEDKYDFRKLGNSHIYNNQEEQLVEKSDDEYGVSQIDNGLKLPSFFKQTISIPGTVTKPIQDLDNYKRSRNQQMKEKNKTLSYTINNDNMAVNEYNKQMIYYDRNLRKQRRNHFINHTLDRDIIDNP